MILKHIFLRFGEIRVRRCALRGASLLCAGRHSEVCLWLGRVESREWCIMCHLRFVLDGIRSPFRQVVLKCVFMFK